jgi:hypothetical protein
MKRKYMLPGAVLAVAISLSTPAFAAANDYIFEPLNAQINKGEDVTLSVRLRHKPTGTVVTDAVIVRTRIDMAPDGMAEMAAPIATAPSAELGVYSFKTELSMEGRWLLSIAVKVQGEAETVIGKITFQASE